MARIRQCAAASVCVLALVVVAAATGLAPSTQASGATHAKAKHRATRIKAKQRCGSRPARRGRKRKHKPSVRGHAARKQQHHRNLSRCVTYAARKRVARKGTEKPAAPSVPVNPLPTPGVPNPQTTWAPVGTPPLSDAEAAAKITPEPEVRPEKKRPTTSCRAPANSPLSTQLNTEAPKGKCTPIRSTPMSTAWTA